MTINKNLLSMTDAELQQWVAERRAARTIPFPTKRSKKSKALTVTQLAKELGVDKSQVLNILADEV